jgi:hypothetical protein
LGAVDEVDKELEMKREARYLLLFFLFATDDS